MKENVIIQMSYFSETVRHQPIIDASDRWDSAPTMQDPNYVTYTLPRGINKELERKRTLLISCICVSHSGLTPEQWWPGCSKTSISLLISGTGAPLSGSKMLTYPHVTG